MVRERDLPRAGNERSEAHAERETPDDDDCRDPCHDLSRLRQLQGGYLLCKEGFETTVVLEIGVLGDSGSRPS